MIEREHGSEAARLRAASALLLSLADGVGPGSAVEEAQALLAVVDQVELALCTRIEQADRGAEYAADGSASATAWVRNAANSSGGLASRRVRLGRALADRLPHTGDSWAAGTCTAEHADVIARATRELDEVQTEVLDRELSLLAAHVSPIELARLAERYRHEIAPEETAAKARRAHREQQLHHSQTFEDRWVLSATFDAEAGAIVNAAIEAFTGPPVAPPEGQLPESAAFRRAEALAEICRQALEHGQGRGAGGEKPQLIITLDDEVLRSGIGHATLADGSPVGPRQLRRLACDARVIPVLYGTKSVPLDIGRSARVVTPGMRRALVLRDQGCAFPRCDRPPSWTDAHHVVHWRDGGATALSNLVLLCRHHHHRVHDDGWTVIPGVDGRFEFRPPEVVERIRYGVAA